MKYNLYIFIFIEILFFIIIYFLKNNKIKKKIFLVLTLLFAFYLGARSIEIGADTKVYVSEYLRGDGGYFHEIGFRYLGILLYNLGFSYQAYLIFLSIFNTILFYFAFRLLEEEFYIIFWFFLFNVTYLYGIINIVRQSIAASFIFIAFMMLKKKKIIKYYIFLFISTLFHQTALIFIGIPFFYKNYKKIENKNKYKILILIFILSLILKNYFLLYPKFKAYFSLDTNLIYIKVILSLLVYFYYSKLKEKNIFLEYIVYYQLCVIILFLDFKLVSSRFLYYINCYTPILITNIFLLKFKSKKILYGIIWLYHLYVIFYPSTVEMFKWNI